MNKILTIYAIRNGFLMETEKGKFQSFQDYSSHDQRKLLLNYVCQYLKIKNLRVVDDKDAAKMILEREDGEKETK